MNKIPPAIAFAKWIASQHGEMKFHLEDNDWYWSDDKDGDQPLSEEYIYDLYLQSLPAPKTESMRQMANAGEKQRMIDLLMWVAENNVSLTENVWCIEGEDIQPVVAENILVDHFLKSHEPMDQSIARANIPADMDDWCEAHQQYYKEECQECADVAPKPVEQGPTDVPDIHVGDMPESALQQELTKLKEERDVFRNILEFIADDNDEVKYTVTPAEMKRIRNALLRYPQTLKTQ